MSLPLLGCDTDSIQRARSGTANSNDGAYRDIQRLDADLDMMLKYEQWQSRQEWEAMFGAARDDQDAPKQHDE